MVLFAGRGAQLGAIAAELRDLGGTGSLGSPTDGLARLQPIGVLREEGTLSALSVPAALFWLFFWKFK